MGLVLAAGFLVSATVDIATGSLFQRLLADPRAASRLQFVGACACSATLALVFLGAWLPVELRFGYSLAAGLAFRFSFGLYDVPQNALMALATDDLASRLRLASIRIWVSGAATLFAAAMVGPLMTARSGGAAPVFLFWLSGLFAILAISSAWALSRLLRWRGARPAGGLRPVARSRGYPVDFWLLLFVMLVTALFTPLFGKLEPYFATYVLHSPLWGGVVVILMALGIVAGQPLWLRLSGRMPRGWLMAATALLQMGALAAFWVIGAASPVGAAAAAFLFGLGNGGVGMVQWAAFSETVARMGPERAGLSYGIFSGTGKLAFAAGALLLATVLARIDLDGPGALDLVWFMALIPGLGAIGSALAGIGLFVSQRRIAPPRSS